MNALVGYTGFVGSNICAEGHFDALYNSKNIKNAYGTNPDFLVYAGLRAEKYLANHAPDQDMELIVQAENNIEKINPKKLMLISTIDVFENPIGVDETSEVDTGKLHPYGYNRYQLELWVRERYPDALIIRLPGLFGKNIKKNFIYDYLHVIPFMLTEAKFQDLSAKNPELNDYYRKQENGFFKVDAPKEDLEHLKDIFRTLGFSALNFTDSRSIYQFYNLSRLWTDIQTALRTGITLWHPATEPVSAAEVYEYLTGEKFVNKLTGSPAVYDYRTVYDDVFGGKNGYIASKKQILEEIRNFTEEYMKQGSK